MSVQRWQVAGAVVDRIEEMLGPLFDARSFFPDHDEAVLERVRLRLGDDHVTERGRIIASMHSWLVRIDGKLVLVDGCIGDGKDRQPYHRWTGMDSGWEARLASVGVTPEQIDFVCCTHLHVDHVGWNTRLRDGRWQPTFPNARYLFSKREVEHARELRAQPKADDFARVSDKVWDDSVLPVLEAGLVDEVGDGHDLLPGRLHIEATPGHTPGSCSIVLCEHGEDRALFTGDVCHHPVQVFEPDWNSDFCEDAEQARRTRRALLGRLADGGALMMPAHFGWPHAVRIHRAGDGFDLEFVEPDEVLTR